MIDQLEVAYLSFYASYGVIIELNTKISREGNLDSGMVADKQKRSL